MVNAVEIEKLREYPGERVVMESVIWRVPVPLRGCVHYFKYRLALVVDGVVKTLNVEGPGKFEVSDAESMLKQTENVIQYLP